MYVLLPVTLSSEPYKMISNSFQNYTWLLKMPAYCFDFNLVSTIEGFKERCRFYTTTITYIHARTLEIFVGFGDGGGVQARLTEKSSDVDFFFFLCKSSAYFAEGVQWSWLFQRKLSLSYNFPIFHGEGHSNISRGVQLFPGGGGPIAYFYINI